MLPLPCSDPHTWEVLEGGARGGVEHRRTVNKSTMKTSYPVGHVSALLHEIKVQVESRLVHTPTIPFHLLYVTLLSVSVALPSRGKKLREGAEAWTPL